MKNILLGSVAFLLFSISVSILQTSCDKDANASPGANTGLTQLNKIVFIKRLQNYDTEIWTANYDGTGQTKINITLPAGYEVDYDYGVKLSPDGKMVFCIGHNHASSTYHLYSCNLDGSNVSKIIDGTGLNLMVLGGAY